MGKEGMYRHVKTKGSPIDYLLIDEINMAAWIRDFSLPR
jgi:hypothetical protein